MNEALYSLQEAAAALREIYAKTPSYDQLTDKVKNFKKEGKNLIEVLANALQITKETKQATAELIEAIKSLNPAHQDPADELLTLALAYRKTIYTKAFGRAVSRKYQSKIKLIDAARLHDHIVLFETQQTILMQQSAPYIEKEAEALQQLLAYIQNH